MLIIRYEELDIKNVERIKNIERVRGSKGIRGGRRNIGRMIEVEIVVIRSVKRMV
jgi:hypothetical protein